MGTQAASGIRKHLDDWYWLQHDRFERHIRGTRTDTMALTVPGLHRQLAVHAIEMLLDTDRITRNVRDYARKTRQDEVLRERPEQFCRIFLEALGVDVDVFAGTHLNIPAEGPVILVGNHPHGILEVMAMAAQVITIRSDVKALANLSICHHPLYGRFLLPIDFRETDKAMKTNLRSVAAFRAHVRAGGMGMIAPAGRVSTRQALSRKATDSAWQVSAAKLARQTGATVIPTFCGSENPTEFHFASKLSYTLRLAVLFRQNWLLRNTVLPLAIGEPIPAETLRAFPSSIEATAFLREAAYGLEQRAVETATVAPSAAPAPAGAA